MFQQGDGVYPHDYITVYIFCVVGLTHEIAVTACWCHVVWVLGFIWRRLLFWYCK